MDVGGKFNNLKKEGTKEDKVAVASSIAVAVVLVLLAGWAFYFFKSIQRNPDQIKLGGGIQDQFNFQNVTDANAQLQQNFGNQQQDLQQIRDQSAQSAGDTGAQTMQLQGQESSGFGQ